MSGFSAVGPRVHGPIGRQTTDGLSGSNPRHSRLRRLFRLLCVSHWRHSFWWRATLGYPRRVNAKLDNSSGALEVPLPEGRGEGCLLLALNSIPQPQPPSPSH